jgi:hypothetical protein
MRATAVQFCVKTFLAASVLLVVGCGYGEVSPAAYDFATALYSISNVRAGDRLNEVSTMIESARTSGKLTDKEATWLTEIVSDARSGDWETAAKKSRRIVADQVKGA